MRGAILVVASLVAAGIVALFVFNPLLGLIVSEQVIGTGYGHSKNPPPVAAGYDFTIGKSDNPDRNRAWTQILRRAFPDGFSVAAMQATLHGQGFAIARARHSAGFDWGGMPCLNSLYVFWTEDGGRLISIQGSTAKGCL